MDTFVKHPPIDRSQWIYLTVLPCIVAVRTYIHSSILHTFAVTACYRHILLDLGLVHTSRHVARFWLQQRVAHLV